ncbi:MAG: hypothetical protein H6622_00950 [Halobacteriovoraceae bacterium]|nr:hypothetical protein [Halobacteriovoraceae bacterium]
MKIFVSFLIVFFITSCAELVLTPAQKKIRVLYKSDAPMNCTEIGEVHGYGFNHDYKSKTIRISADEIGANLVVITNDGMKKKYVTTISKDINKISSESEVEENDSGEIRGIAYSCPVQK